MPNPLQPNYVKDIGRLVTDRYDFQNHIEGLDFRHKASQIDLSTPILVNESVTNNLEDALIKINDALTAELTIPNASETLPGVIQLIGDIQNNGIGTGNQIKVIGIQGKPVSNLTPAEDQVLIYKDGQWEPGTSPSKFVAGGDLTGTSLIQRVVNIYGNSGTATITANNLIFDQSTTPAIKQSAKTGAATNFNIYAQDSTNNNGGKLILNGGNGDGTSTRLDGGVLLNLGHSNTLIELSQQKPGAVKQRILSLLNPSGLNTTQMPANTGDLVAFMADTLSPPTSSPNGGVIIYSQDGSLHVKQSDGEEIIVGKTPNPDVRMDGDGKFYTENKFTSVIGNAEQFLFVYPISGELSTNTTYQVQASILAKEKVDGYGSSYVGLYYYFFTILSDGSIENLTPGESGVISSIQQIEHQDIESEEGISWDTATVQIEEISGNKKITIKNGINNWDANYFVKADILSCFASE